MALSFERFVLISIWAVGLTACLLIPADKRREGWIAFLMCQAFSWIGALLEVRLGWIAFPVREFPRATDLGVTTEFFFYPLCCALYFIFEPRRTRLMRGLYLLIWAFGLAMLDGLLSNYTDLLEYGRYAWYWSALDIALIFAVSNVYTRWFFKSSAMRSERRMPP
ncbi:CBO0543 family protein [Paenibacillus hemerocallicola]|nr:CBO0543 family protein [Paenibacillus hemerocallicola]